MIRPEPHFSLTRSKSHVLTITVVVDLPRLPPVSGTLVVLLPHYDRTRVDAYRALT